LTQINAARGLRPKVQLLRAVRGGHAKTARPMSFYAIFISSHVFYIEFLYDPPYISATWNSTNSRIVSGENAMDILYIGLIVGFGAVSIGLAYYCERLRRPQ
jgi:hypothetical protein